MSAVDWGEKHPIVGKGMTHSCYYQHICDGKESHGVLLAETVVVNDTY